MPPGPQPGSIEWLVKMLSGTIETPAEQEARIQRELDAWQRAQQKLLDDEYARSAENALRMQQASAAAGSAAAAMSKDLFGQVGGEYNKAAQEIAGLAHGLTGAAGAATMADVSAANQGLGRVGAPGVPVGGPGGVGGPTQQGVENYLGGTLGSQLLTGLGEGASFGLAGMTSAQNLRATQEAQAALMTSMRDIEDNKAKAVDALIAGRADLAHQYMTDARDAQIRTISLIQGLTAQQQANKMDLPTQVINGELWERDPVKGWHKVIRATPGGAVPVRLTFQNIKGHKVGINPYTGQIVADYGPASAGGTKPTNLQIKQVVGPDGKIHDVAINPTTGKVVVDYGPRPATGGRRGGTGRKPTVPIEEATDYIKTAYYGYVDIPAPTAASPNATRRVPAWQAPGFDPDSNEADFGTGGTPTGFLPYPKALAYLTRAGYSRDQARNMLNELYAQPGSQGRPIFSAEEQTYLRGVFGNRRYEAFMQALMRAARQGAWQNLNEWRTKMLNGTPLW